MKIKVERSLLSEVVSRLQKVVGNKTSMPVLEGILISAETDKVTLISYNLEMGMRKEIYADVEEEGDIVINAKILSDIVRKLRGDYVVIETNERLTCTISCKDTVFEIMGMAASDYPEMPVVSEGNRISVSGEQFSDMVRGTLFAVSQIEGTKPILTGLNISLKGIKLVPPPDKSWLVTSAHKTIKYAKNSKSNTSSCKTKLLLSLFMK